MVDWMEGKVGDGRDSDPPFRSFASHARSPRRPKVTGKSAESELQAAPHCVCNIKRTVTLTSAGREADSVSGRRGGEPPAAYALGLASYWLSVNSMNDSTASMNATRS